jgi:hypothetical protein
MHLKSVFLGSTHGAELREGEGESGREERRERRSRAERRERTEREKDGPLHGVVQEW